MARDKRVPLWTVDRPEYSSVIMPAVVACGHLRVAISTSGVAPALSGFIKEDMEKIFGQEFAAFVDWLGQLREQAKATEPDAEKRRQLLREALDGFRFMGAVKYPQVWLEERAKMASGVPRSDSGR
jgi:precorrin-2 dehydrogenase/sirohydrochlorin ferrochelatase